MAAQWAMDLFEFLHKRSYDIWLSIKENRLSIGLILLAIAIYSLLLLTPYLINDPYFEVGFDTGVYERTVNIFHNADNWRGSLPSYPSTADYDTEWMDKMEPGLMVHLGLAYSYSDIGVRDLFRWVMPTLMAVFMVLIVFVIANRITGSEIGGGLAAVLVASMNLQIEIVNESLYKQFIAIVLVLAMLYGLDRLLYDKDERYFVPVVLMAGATYYYHYATAFTTFIFLGLIVFASLLIKNRWAAKKVTLISVISLLTILPAFIPRLGRNVPEIVNAFIYSYNRTGMLGTDEGTLYGGGAIPYLLWDYQHILIGYILVFLPFVIMFLVGSFILFKNKCYTFLFWMATTLIAYIGLWLYFGNRMIYELDVMIGIISAVGLFGILTIIWKTKNRSYTYVSVIVVILILSASITCSFQYQTEKSPYIVNNIDGVRWLEDNVPIEGSVIFAPDIISADLIQLGYRMAIWDYSIPTDGTHPIDDAEDFMLYAPSNSSFTDAFFNQHPNLRNLTLIVLWGQQDYDRPLVSSKKIIPFEEYVDADNFILEYSGYSEIVSIYRYVG